MSAPHYSYQGKTNAPRAKDIPDEEIRTLILISWVGDVPERAEVELRYPYAMLHQYREAPERKGAKK